MSKLESLSVESPSGESLSFGSAATPTTGAPALRGYHMVAAITESTINFQFAKLWKARVIQRELELKVGSVNLAATMGAPRVVLSEGDRPGSLVFVLPFTRGTLSCWDLSGEEPVKLTVPFAGWTYAFRVHVDFAQIARDAALDHRAIPAEVKRTLQAFSADDFTIRRLFMNFQNADLASFEPAYTSLPLGGEHADKQAIVEQFRHAVAGYVKQLAGQDHPYILGYSIEKRPTARPPALFEPTGATFSVTRHPTRAELSTLNFLLMTEQVPVPAEPDAPRFVRNWIDGSDHDGRMLIEGALFRRRYLDEQLAASLLRAVDLPAWQPVADREEAKRRFEIDDGTAARQFPRLPPGTRAAFRHSHNLDREAPGFDKGCGQVVGRDSNILNIYREDRDDISCAVWTRPGPDLVVQGVLVLHRSQTFCTYPANIRTYNCSASVTVEQPFAIRLGAGRKGELVVELIAPEPTVKTESHVAEWLKLASFLSGLFGGGSLEQIAARSQASLEDQARTWRERVKATLEHVLARLETCVVLPAGNVLYYKNATYLAADDVVAFDVSYVTERAEAVGDGLLASASPATLEHRHAFMKHHLPVAPIDAGRAIAAGQDADGEPLLFSVTGDGRFVVCHRGGAGAGWARADLTPAAAKGLVAGAFAVSQGSDGDLYLALAMHPPDRPEAARLFVSPPQPANLAVNDWGRTASRWVERTYGDRPGRITALHLGTTDDGLGAPLGLAVVAGEREATHVRINTEAADSSWAWAAFPLPENARDITGLALGTVDGERGLYTLYRVGRAQALVFTSLPDPDFGGKVARYDFELPGDVAALAVLPGKGASTDLYVGGAGVHVFRGSAVASRVVVPPSALPAVRGLLACTDGAKVSLWCHGADHRLEHVEGAGEVWSSPVCLGRDVAQVAPLRNRARRTDALFTVGRGGELRHRWFDPGRDAWAVTDIALPSLGVTTEIDCFATHVSMRGATARTVAVTASSWTSAVINGRATILDPDEPVAVELDLTGELTVLQPVDGLSAACLTFAGAGLPAPVTVDPLDPIRARLRAIRSGADLASARTGSGKPLVAGASAAACDAAARSLQALLPAEDRLGGGAMLAADAGLDAIGSWALDVVSGTFDLGRTLAEVFGAGVEAIKVAAGDAIESMRQAFETIGRIAAEVVGEGLRFVVELGERLVSFVVETATQVYQVVQWVLKATLGLDLDDLVDWLGFVFSWEDILSTQRLLAHVARSSFAHAKAQLVGAEPAIERAFREVRAGLELLTSLPAEQRQGRLGASPGSGAGDRPGAGAATTSPAGDWLRYQLAHGAAAQGAGLPLPIPKALLDVVRAFMTELVAPLVDSVTTSGKALFDELGPLLERGELTFEAMATRLGRGVLFGLLDALATVARGALRFLGELVMVLRDMVDAELEIPVLSGLYRLVTRGGRMTALDVLCLALAVPATTIFKLVTSRRPFSAAEVEAVLALEPQALFARLSGGGAASATELALAADAADPAAEPSFADRYSQVGGIVYGLATMASGGAEALAASTDLLKMPPMVDLEGAGRFTKFMVRKEVLQLALSAVKIGASFPTGESTPSVWLTRGVWFLQFPLLLKDLIMLFAPEKFTGEAILGTIEIIEALFEGAALSAAAILDLCDTRNEQYDPLLSLWNWGENLAGAAGTIVIACTRFNPDPQTKPIMGAVGGGLAVGAGLSSLGRAGYAAYKQRTHYAY